MVGLMSVGVGAIEFVIDVVVGGSRWHGCAMVGMVVVIMVVVAVAGQWLVGLLGCE